MTVSKSRIIPRFRINLSKVVRLGTNNMLGNEDQQKSVFLCQIEMQLINSFSDLHKGEKEELFCDADLKVTLY